MPYAVYGRSPGEILLGALRMGNLCNVLRRQRRWAGGSDWLASSRGESPVMLRGIHPVSVWIGQKFAAAATSSVPMVRSVCTTSAPKKTTTLA
jgi:hypothetical protein